MNLILNDFNLIIKINTNINFSVFLINYFSAQTASVLKNCHESGMDDCKHQKCDHHDIHVRIELVISISISRALLAAIFATIGIFVDVLMAFRAVIIWTGTFVHIVSFHILWSVHALDQSGVESRHSLILLICCHSLFDQVWLGFRTQPLHALKGFFVVIVCTSAVDFLESITFSVPPCVF